MTTLRCAAFAVILSHASVAFGAIPTPTEPLTFERNDGQHDKDVAFVARATSYSVILDARGATIAAPLSDDGPQTRLVTSRLSFKGSNVTAIEPLDRIAAVSNFFSERQAITDVPNYARVAYRNLYHGIDAVFHASRTNDVEVDFVIAPGATPDAISLELDGPWTPTANGDLQLCAGGATILLHRPVAYQVIAGARHRVAVAYASRSDRIIHFEIGAYDPAHALIIDPVVSYVTAVRKATLTDITVDKRQNVYIVGYTTNSTFVTTPGAYQPTFAGLGEDAVIIKYNKDGQRILPPFSAAWTSSTAPSALLSMTARRCM